ncbi:hypothetical protein Tco_0496520, partial [Tanacetum coccineum]
MAMNRYENLTKKRVSASNVPRVLPARDGCQRNGSKNEIVERCEYRILAISTTKKKGPTMMHGIHVREFDARTIARNASYAPLTYSFYGRNELPDRDDVEDGHRRIFGRGVTNTLIKKVNGDGSASMGPREIVKSPTVSLEVEKVQFVDTQRGLEANFERII